MPRPASPGGRVKGFRWSVAPTTSPSTTSVDGGDVSVHPAPAHMYPAVSAVLPAYNEEAVIAETVRRTGSALTELGVADFEILVIDDGSSDATAARATRAESPRKRARPWGAGRP